MTIGGVPICSPESRTRITVVLDSRISYLPSPFYARTTRADASKSIGSSKEVKIQPFTRSIGMSREYGSKLVSSTAHQKPVILDTNRNTIRF